jgi:uncharacterized protein YndB with AHSA1/START domain
MAASRHDQAQPQTHATFVIERTYPAPVDAVWHALSDDACDQWFTALVLRRDDEAEAVVLVGRERIAMPAPWLDAVPRWRARH